MKIWLNLFWKEWHEQKWKLMALTAIALSVCMALLFQDFGNATDGMFFTILAYAQFGPLFVGMGVCAGEHASGAIDFVRAQPVSLRRVAAVRWIAGACTLLVPWWCASALCWIAMYFQIQGQPQSVRTNALFVLHAGWSESRTLIAFSLAGTAACLNLYAWIVAIAVNQRTEFRAGLLGMLVAVAIGVVGIVSMYAGVDMSTLDVPVARLIGVASGPLASTGVFTFFSRSQFGYIFITIAWQLTLAFSLMQIMVLRYGRAVRWLSPPFSINRMEVKDSALPGKPRASQWHALLWLQLRQSIPICVVGLCVVLAIAVLSAGLAPGPASGLFDTMFPTVGCVLALLIGVGSFVSELQPDLHTFWRSRPISPSHWFWFKYTGGALALVGLFDLPCVLLTWSGIAQTSSPGFAAVFPVLLHLLCYSFAVFAACSVRHSSYSTALAVCALSVILVPELADFRVPRFLSFFAMWGDAADASRQIEVYAQEFGGLAGHRRILESISVFVMPACMLIGALAISTSIAAAFLVKRNISVGP